MQNTTQAKKTNPILIGCLSIVGLFILGFLILFIIGLFSSSKKDSTKNMNNTKTETTHDINIENKNLHSRIQNEIKSFEKPFDRGNIGFKGLLNMIDEYREIVLKGENSDVDSIVELSKSLKPHVIKFQTTYFPVIRREYATEMNKKMWEFDVEVKFSGKGNKNLTYVGGMFAANKNIKEAYERMREDLLRMRFKEVNFKWIPSASEWDYYKIESKKDNEL